MLLFRTSSVRALAAAVACLAGGAGCTGPRVRQPFDARVRELQWVGWDRSTMRIDAGGKFTVTAAASSSDVSGGGTEPGARGAFDISSEGTVSVRGSSAYHGTLSRRGDCLVITGTNRRKTYDLMVSVKGGGTFAAADLEGTWHVHALASGDAPAWHGWVRSTVVVDAGGSCTVTKSASSSDISEGGPVRERAPGFPGVLSASPEGLVSAAEDPSLLGKMSPSKDLIVLTMNGDRGGCELLFMIRGAPADAAPSFAASDLEGTWHVHTLVSGDAPQWTGWSHGTIVVGDRGAFSWTKFADSDGDEKPGAPGQIAISSDGTVTLSAESPARGTMSAARDLIVVTGDDPRGGSRVQVLQKEGGWSAASDLEGTWYAHTLSAGDAEEMSYALRYRRPRGTADRYQAKYKVVVRQKEMGRRARGAGFQRLVRDKFESDEEATAEVTFHFTGKTANDRFDRVVIRRRNVKRDLLEVAPNGRVTRDKKLGVPYQPLITRNFEAEPSTRDFYYIAMDELGRIARRKETPYHYAWGESLCYMFPTFPKQEVRVGDSWPFRVPVIVGVQYSGNEMVLNGTATFSDLRRVDTGRGGGEGVRRAVIDYTYYAILDTRHPDDAHKLPPGLPGGAADVVWRRFTVEGEGEAHFDIEAGKVVWKRDSYRVSIEHEYDRLVTRSARERERDRDRDRDRDVGDRAPETERMHYTAVNTVEFSSRLLAPGERAGERPSRRE